MARSLERESIGAHLGLLMSGLACLGELTVWWLAPGSDVLGRIRVCGLGGLSGSLLAVWAGLEYGFAGPRVRLGIVLGACAALFAAVVYCLAVANLGGS